MNLDTLTGKPRLLIEAQLKPVQSIRFQPTGFPDLGAAEFDDPDGGRMLLVESPQSIANHLERTVFKEFSRDTVSACLADAVAGIPYVDIDLGDFGRTNTLLEAHRLNTAYLWESSDDSAIRVQTEILKDLGVSAKRKKKGDAEDGSSEMNEVSGVVDMKRFYRTLLKYDPNSLLHGVFLEKVAGRLRLPRAVSGFIEARGVKPVESGGVKNDHVFPKKDEASGITSKDGFTNVPFSRTEFLATDIRAYFNVDLALIRGFGLGKATEDFLIALALFKIRRFLDEGLRLRSACDLELCSDWICKTPSNFVLPERKDIEASLPLLIDAVTREERFAEPLITTVIWNGKRRASQKRVILMPMGTSTPVIPNELAKTVKWKKGTKSKAPSLEITEALDADLIETLCDLFPGNTEAQEAIRGLDHRSGHPRLRRHQQERGRLGRTGPSARW
ncbi:type I-U CRISPR-associated RAMP protein Csb1/Cas7u [uncultured Thiodictyon sp.]|uniref:type I-G CRISPR-associated RAMP protein Csb1/Cas7g n=1 Tax=uncultured Thiodictyon sp. TaxID=1846217 RepID=UPI0025F98D80|nr:type I-U CRISPR-associated RAMP protein Csb1/Cas7u [uncultured Thiodictyon sp.]